MKKIKALIFDLDDTLVDSSSAYPRALKAVGIDPKNKKYQLARKLTKDRLPSLHPSARNRLTYFKLMMGSQISSRKLLALTHRYEKALEQDLRRQWKELGRDQLFTELSKKFKILILTNENTRTQIVKLSAIDPEGRYFSDILTSEEVGVEKPDLKGFKLLLKNHRLKSQECVFVGDSETADMKPAQQLKMLVIHTHEFTQKPSRKFASVSSLNDIEKLLKELR